MNIDLVNKLDALELAMEYLEQARAELSKHNFDEVLDIDTASEILNNRHVVLIEEEGPVVEVGNLCVGGKT